MTQPDLRKLYTVSTLLFPSKEAARKALEKWEQGGRLLKGSLVLGVADIYEPEKVIRLSAAEPKKIVNKVKWSKRVIERQEEK